MRVQNDERGKKWRTREGKELMIGEQREGRIGVYKDECGKRRRTI